MQEGHLFDGEVCLLIDSLLEKVKYYSHIQVLCGRPIHTTKESGQFHG
jgi:hypothetical protein